MFGRRFAYMHGRGDWQGWTPPWLQHDWHGPRFFGKGRFFGPDSPWVSPEAQALQSEAIEVAKLFAIASRRAIGNGERVSQLRAFLDRSRKELATIIGESTENTPEDTPNEGQA